MLQNVFERRPRRITAPTSSVSKSTKEQSSDESSKSIKPSIHRSSTSREAKISNQQFEALLNRIGNPGPSNNTSTININPDALGLGSFALSCFILSVFNAGSNLIDNSLLAVVLPVAFLYGGVTEFAAGMWDFRIGNTFGGVVFTSYGAFWMSFAAYGYFILPGLQATGKAHHATGLFILAWLIFTIFINIAAFRTSRYVFTLFVVLNLTFLLLVIGNLANNSVVINVGGWVGIVLSFIAWYGTGAIVINSTWKGSFIPLGVCAARKKEDLEESKTKS